MNLDLFAEDLKTPQEFKLKDGHLIYYKDFFKNSMIQFNTLEDKIIWRQDHISLYGKTHPIPRLQAWYCDPGVSYSYSGVKLKENHWFEELASIKQEVEKITKSHFNGCLCNLYRNGRDYAAYHSDDELELGKNPLIASVSFGGERRFVLKHKENKGIEKFELTLSSGSLLIMKGQTQHFWKHQLAKTMKTVPPRINLTFRKLL